MGVPESRNERVSSGSPEDLDSGRAVVCFKARTQDCLCYLLGVLFGQECQERRVIVEAGEIGIAAGPIELRETGVFHFD